MFDTLAWQVAKPIAGIALMGGAVWGFTKLLDKADEAMVRSNERHDQAKRDATGGSVKDRIERTDGLASDDHVTHATVLVRAFDRDGDDRLVRDEWKLQAGSDSLDGSRLFSAARYIGDSDDGPSTAVTIDQVAATLDIFAPTDFVERLNDDKHHYAYDHYEHTLQPREADDAREMAERGLFEKGEEYGATRTRPIEIAAAEVLARYDASGDGAISIDGESTYDAGDFHGDASRLLDLADRDGSGNVDFRELRTHLTTLDAWSAQGWESEPGPNGLLDGNDWRGDGLESL
jgi:hypothetical protein